MPNQRQLQKSQTRAKVVDVAMQVYAEQNLSTSTLAVAKAAHVSHGTIFAHFPTKDDLLIAMVQQVCTPLVTATDAATSLPDFLQQHIAVLTKYEALYRRFISEQDALPAAAKQVLAAAQATVAVHFQAALATTSVKSIAPGLLFNTWQGLVQYYLLNSEQFAPTGSVLARYGDTLIDTFERLIS